jgi:hypothetical protein
VVRNVCKALLDIEEGSLGVCLPALRGGHWPQTAGGSAVDTVLHSVPGNHRPQRQRR